jgi:hypothetical protein
MSNVRVRGLSGLQAVALTQPAEADLALINAHYSRAPMTAEDLHVRQARVAHNNHDRTGERFPKLVLERFAETLPGKSFLSGHDTGSAPLGRWFRADTRTRTEPAFPVLVTEAAEGAGKAQVVTPGMELVPGFRNESARVTWLEAGFYFVNAPDTELMRKNIDSGVWQDVSIGFSFDRIDCDLCKKDYLGGQCPHIFMMQDRETGKLATGTYSGDPLRYEARETSNVYLGAQQGAEFMKSLRAGRLDPKALAQTPYGEDLVALKRYEALARRFGHAQKSWTFPGLAKAFPAKHPEATPAELEWANSTDLSAPPRRAEADAPNYRPAGDEDQSCAACMHRADDGTCARYSFTPNDAYVCDSFESEPEEMPMEGEDAYDAPVAPLKAADVTNFPQAGDDQAVSLRNSGYPQFDRAYAEALREGYPSIWRRGGNIRGNDAFTLWGRARNGEETAGVLDWIREREAWAARHFQDNRLPGVVAQIKWGVIGTLGEGGMKDLVNEAKARAEETDSRSVERGTPSVDGKTEQSVPVGTTDQGGSSMKVLFETLQAKRGLPSDATEEQAVKALEEALAAAEKAAGLTELEAARSAAETKQADAEKALTEAKPLIELGEKALKFEADRYIAEAKKLGRPEAEVVIVAQAFQERKDLDGLRALADETFAAVVQRYPDRIGRTEQELAGVEKAEPLERFRLV